MFDWIASVCCFFAQDALEDFSRATVKRAQSVHQMVAMYGSNGSDKGDTERLATTGGTSTKNNIHETRTGIRPVRGSSGGLVSMYSFLFGVSFISPRVRLKLVIDSCDCLLAFRVPVKSQVCIQNACSCPTLLWKACLSDVIPSCVTREIDSRHNYE